tara:strand:+ start:2131 stop:2436 length:306 start_codon:yes stop_codon:yes gene_type:complete
LNSIFHDQVVLSDNDSNSCRELDNEPSVDLESEYIDQKTESGAESNSIIPDKFTDSLAEKPLLKSNPILGGSPDSALAEGVMTTMAAAKTIARAMGLEFII